MTDKPDEKPVRIEVSFKTASTVDLHSVRQVLMPIVDDGVCQVELCPCPVCGQPESYGCECDCECEDDFEGEEDPEEEALQFGADMFERFGY